VKRTALARGSPLKRRYLKSGHKHEKEALDKLARTIVFQRDPMCQRCAKRENSQWCHVSSRRYVSLRWRLENSLRLCAGCHLWWHHRPLEAVAWFEQAFPKRAKEVRLMSMCPQRVDLKLERLYLLSMAQQYGVDTKPWETVKSRP
jgi:hypothetical protein